MLLLGAFLAAQTLGGCRRAEVGAAIATARAAQASRPRTRTKAPAARTRPAEAAASAAAEATAAKAAWPGTAGAWACRSRSAEALPWRTRRRPVFASAGLADRQVAPLERLRVELLNDFLCHRTFGELDEGKPARPSGLTVDGHHHMGRFGDCGKVRAEICLACTVGKIPNEETDCQDSLVKGIKRASHFQPAFDCISGG